MQIVGALSSPWAIIPDKLAEITDIYSAHLRGERADIAAIEARIGARPVAPNTGYDVINGVAVIPVQGIIAKKMNMFTQISGGVSTQILQQNFQEALADSEIRGIVLHLDTPGGAVDGTTELASDIYAARGKKPIYALADGLMASAGVWIGSAADKVFVSSATTSVGSIGVVTQHIDSSERDKKRGITVTDIYAGKYKRIAGENKPLSEEGQAYLQAHVDYMYSLFVNDVAKHRGVSTATALENMADGRIFVGQQSIDAGLADGFASRGELIAGINSHTSASPQSGVPQALVSGESSLRAKWDKDHALRVRYCNDFEVFKTQAEYNARIGT